MARRVPVAVGRDESGAGGRIEGTARGGRRHESVS